MSMKLHSKLGSILRIETKVLKRLHAARPVNGATNSQKDSVEAYVGSSLAEMLTKRAALLLGDLKLVKRRFTGPTEILLVSSIHHTSSPHSWKVWLNWRK